MPAERIRCIEAACGKSMRANGYERADFPDGPGRLSTFLRNLRQVPEALRFGWVYLRLARHLRDPRHFYDATSDRLFSRINPGAWAHYPDFSMPTPPPLPADGLPELPRP